MLANIFRSGTLTLVFRIFLMALPFVMASCAFEGGPYPYPSGYTYQGSTFKSPGGPKVKKQDPLLIATTPTIYNTDNDDVTVDRSALDQVAAQRVQQQQMQQQPAPAMQFERVVE